MYSFHNRDNTVRRNVKKSSIFIVTILVLGMLFTVGCGGSSETTAVPGREYEIAKVAKVNSVDGQWQIYQLNLKIEGGGKFTVDLNLAAGDRVDCYFKVEKPSEGGSMSCQVKAGDSVIYTSPGGVTGEGNTSDRFSFTASPANGTSYRIIFQNTQPDIKSKQTIFTEIIYPVKSSGEDSIFIPLDVK
jgi:hypothetical protein